MSTQRKINDILEGLEVVSENALTKHGFSRSRQRIFDLSKSLRKTWTQYCAIDNINSDKRMIYFVIAQSTNGLKVNTITRRTGLPKGVVRDWLHVLFREEKVISAKLYKEKGMIRDIRYHVKK
tara:strand:+ start:68 stop:436 length:369 start_codon:yes stop_codon:yes gene_type:complete